MFVNGVLCRPILNDINNIFGLYLDVFGFGHSLPKFQRISIEYLWYKLCTAVIFNRNLSLTVEVPEGVESINRSVAKYQTCNARLTTNIICALLTGFLQMCTGLMKTHLKFGSLEPIIWESQRKGNWH